MRKRVFWTLIWLTAGSGLNFLTNILLASKLGASNYGQYSLLLSYSTTWVMLLNFGMEYYIPTNLNSENKHQISGILSTIVSLFFISTPIFIILSIYIFELNIFSQVLIVLLSISTLILSVIKHYFIALKKSELSEFIANFFPRASFLVIVSLLLLLIPVDYEYIFLIYTVIYVLIAIIFSIKFFRLRQPDFGLIKYSFVYYCTVLLYGLFAPLSRFIQEYLHSSQSVGQLSIALSIGQVISLFATSFTAVAKPEFYVLSKNQDKKGISNLYHSLTSINSIIMLPIIVFVILNAERIMSLLGEDYTSGAIIFILTFSSAAVNTFFGPNGTLLSMSKYAKLEVVSGLLKIVVSLIIAFTFRTNIWAVGLAFLISELVINLFKAIMIYKYFNFLPISLRTLVHIIILSILGLVIFSQITHISNTILWLLVNGSFVLMMILAVALIDSKIRITAFSILSLLFGKKEKLEGKND